MWEGETVFIVAGGPSLRKTDLSLLPHEANVVVINDSYRLCPRADLLYFCDYKWFQWHRPAVEAWPGRAVTAAMQAAAECPKLKWIRLGERTGLAESPDTLNTGRNGGYQAINLAVHAGARRIVLVGFDMAAAPDGASHWHGGHRGRPAHPTTWRDWLPHFETIVEPLRARNVTVVNATIGGALETFPRARLEDEVERWRRQQAA